MSRKPSTAGRAGLSRASSSVNMAMPPPGRIPARAPSVMSSSITSNGLDGERQISPRKSSYRKPMGVAVGGRGDGAEKEINIQVVVRCR